MASKPILTGTLNATVLYMQIPRHTKMSTKNYWPTIKKYAKKDLALNHKLPAGSYTLRTSPGPTPTSFNYRLFSRKSRPQKFRLPQTPGEFIQWTKAYNGAYNAGLDHEV